MEKGLLARVCVCGGGSGVCVSEREREREGGGREGGGGRNVIHTHRDLRQSVRVFCTNPEGAGVSLALIAVSCTCVVHLLQCADSYTPSYVFRLTGQQYHSHS